jgi:hypothetical protein
VRRPRPIEERFWTKVDTSSGDNGCWLWMALKSEKGYGLLWAGSGSKCLKAHRVAYELMVGPIPEGLQLDHLCRNPGCVNPAHLEPVSNRENTLRGTSFAALNAAKTHCPHGHEYTPENTYIENGRHRQRRCRQCWLDRN